MFLKQSVRGYDGTEYVVRRAPFLILMQDKDDHGSPKFTVRACVRKVAMKQCGHWMMGRTRIGKKWYTLSGTYGSDGLLLSVEKDAFDKGVPLPDNLYEAWKDGGGWNSGGSEMPLMQAWALKTFTKECKERDRGWRR
jgi:hypothetical protein